MQAVESALYYISDPDPSRGISLYYFPCSETFESASFGDGRIIFNTTAGDTRVVLVLESAEWICIILENVTMTLRWGFG